MSAPVSSIPSVSSSSKFPTLAKMVVGQTPKKAVPGGLAITFFRTSLLEKSGDEVCLDGIVIARHLLTEFIVDIALKL